MFLPAHSLVFLWHGRVFEVYIMDTSLEFSAFVLSFLAVVHLAKIGVKGSCQSVQ